MKKMNQRLCNTKYIFNIPVWYNSGITIEGKHVFIETLYLNGVTTIGDFLKWKWNYTVKKRFYGKVLSFSYTSNVI